MFQIVFFLIQATQGCKLMTDSLKIYPTEGETYIMPLSKLFGGYDLNYKCLGCTEHIQLWNSFNYIYQNTLEYTTQSLSSNATHFVTLSTSTINLYIYKNQSMKLLCQYNIDSQIECFNSIFTYSNSILIDCYNKSNNNLQFYDLKNCELNLYQTIINQSIPTRTKILNYRSNKQIYLLYAQFYQQYELLSVFQQIDNQLMNKTTWPENFSDFDVTNRFIYIISSALLQQLSIIQEGQLSIMTSYFFTNLNISIKQIKAQTSVYYKSGYDQIYVASYLSKYNFYLQFYQAKNGSISHYQFISSPILGTNTSKVQILISNLYFLLQINNNIYRIYNFVINPNIINFTNSSNPLQFSYVDYFNNILFQFSDQIQINQIKTPQIVIQAPEKKQLYPFKIEGQPEQEKQWNNTCLLTIQPQILQLDDQKIYVMNNLPYEIFFIFQNSFLTFNVLGFSGPLMRTSIIMLNEQLGLFQDFTFTKKPIELKQNFQVASFQSMDDQGLLLFFAGSNNGNIYFYLCFNQTNSKLIYSQKGLLNINSIQIIFFCSEQTLLVGINQGINDIRIYYLSLDENSADVGGFFVKEILIYSFPPYKQFLLTQDNIIVLLESQNIIIQSLASSDQFTLGDKEMSQLFPNYDPKSIHFKPIQMAMNEIDQSSILYINNQNSVIILVVQSTYEIIPYSIIKVYHQIYQINIISELIISYSCGQYTICFQVWDILNLIKPSFIKNLPQLHWKEGSRILSDNIFLYVESLAKTIYVINPALSYHSSLYHEFNYTGNCFCSQVIKKASLIFMDNSFYNLTVVMIQNFFPNVDVMGQEQKYLYQTLFYATVANNFSSIATQNKLLSVINPLTQIKLPQNLSINQTIHVPFNISLDPENYTVCPGQILSYQLIDHKKNTICSLQNYIEQNSKSSSSVSLINQPLYLFMVNSTLIMQSLLYNTTNCFYSKQTNDSSWTQIFCGQENYFNCSTPLVYYGNASNQISQMCFYNKTWYLIIYQYNQNQTLSVIKKIIIAKSKHEVQLQNVDNLTSLLNNTIFFFQAKGGIYFTNNTNTLNTSSNSIYQNNLLPQPVIYYTLQELTYYQNFSLLFYIQNNEIFYGVGTINDSNFQFQNNFQKLFHPTQYFSLGDAQILEIKIISQKQNKLIIFLTTNIAPCFIFEASYFYHKNISSFEIIFDSIVQTIPPYGTYPLRQSFKVIKSLYLLVYSNDTEKIYAIYDLAAVHYKLADPLIMKGGITLSHELPTSLAFNLTTIQDGGLFYDLIDGGINNYQVVGQAYLNCVMKEKYNKTIKLLAYNSFNNGTTVITIYTTIDEWYISLILFLAGFILIASFLCWYHTRGKQISDNFIEELELE